MASVSGLAYRRLRDDEGLVFDEEIEQNKAIILKTLRGWLLRKRVRLTGRQRPRVRVFGLMSRRQLRKRARVFKRIKVSWVKALKRLKSGKARAHWNDLFGGNYLFMQPNPIPFKCGDRPYDIGHGLHGNLPSSTYSLGRIA